MNGQIAGHGEKHGAATFVSIVVMLSCLAMPLAVASLFLRGRTFSVVNAMMVLLFILPPEGLLLRSLRKNGATAVCAFQAGTVGSWIRAAVACTFAGGSTILVYQKYVSMLFGHGERYGRLCMLYDSLALPTPLKAGLLVFLLVALLLLCWLNLYVFLNVACAQSDSPACVKLPARTRPLFCTKQYFTMAIVLFSLCFTVIFFGPVEIVLENGQYLYLQNRDFWAVLLAVALLSALLFSLPGAFFNERAFQLILCTAFGLLLALYVQGTFDRTGLVTLDGAAIHWENYRVAAYLGAAGWIAAVYLQFLLSHLLSKHYKRIAVSIAAAIIAMQTVALVAILLDDVPKKSRYVLDGAPTYTVSSNENIVVFTLDRVSNTTMEQVMEQYPETRSELKDFFYYDNTSARYHLTFPSLMFMITGAEYDPSVPSRRSAKNAWKGERAETFYGTLKRRDFQRNLFIDENYAAVDAIYMLGKADNLKNAPIHLTAPLLLEIGKVSAYRYMPISAKQAFWTTTEQVNAITRIARKEVVPLAYSHEFYQGLMTQGLHTSDDSNYFAWHHLAGAHEPYLVGDDGLLAGHETDPISQTRGYLVAIAEYLKQMQALNIYDRATIIISADHGVLPEMPQINLLIKPPYASNEQMIVRHAPATQEDVLPTIFDCIGEDYEVLGTSIFSLEEDAVRERVTSRFFANPDYPPTKQEAESRHQAGKQDRRLNVLEEYRYTGDRDVIRQKVEQGDVTAIYPLYESFY